MGNKITEADYHLLAEAWYKTGFKNSCPIEFRKALGNPSVVESFGSLLFPICINHLIEGLFTDVKLFDLNKVLGKKINNWEVFQRKINFSRKTKEISHPALVFKDSGVV